MIRPRLFTWIKILSTIHKKQPSSFRANDGASTRWRNMRLLNLFGDTRHKDNIYPRDIRFRNVRSVVQINDSRMSSNSFLDTTHLISIYYARDETAPPHIYAPLFISAFMYIYAPFFTLPLVPWYLRRSTYAATRGRSCSPSNPNAREWSIGRTPSWVLSSVNDKSGRRYTIKELQKTVECVCIRVCTRCIQSRCHPIPSACRSASIPRGKSDREDN